jgi:acetylglutamate kinase
MNEMDENRENSIKKVVEKAQILTEALPYIRDFHNKRVVIKYGSSVMSDSEAAQSVLDDIVWLKLIGMQPIIVHSGSDEITHWLELTGKTVEFINRNRVTDKDAIEIVEMVLGKTNKQLVQNIERLGVKAVGVCGKDNSMIRAKERVIDGVKYGYLGEITQVDTTLIENLLNNDCIPVVASDGVGENFESYNLIADDVACELAKALKAEKLLFLARQDVLDGRKVRVPSAMISTQDARELIEEGRIDDDMVYKLKCSIDAAENGVHRVHIVDGTIPHSILLEFFTVFGVGTAIVKDKKELYPHEVEFR